MNKQEIEKAIEELKYQEDMRAKGIDYQVDNLVINTVISALEKQIPKKPIIKPWSPARCPSCGNELSTYYRDGYYAHRTFMDYCDNKDCLQRLDWRNEL